MARSKRTSSKNRKYQTFQPCVATGHLQEGGNVLHHVKHRGSGGGDDEWNMMPLTTAKHTEIHMGMNRFVEKHPNVRKWLEDNDWYFCEFLKKWTRDKF